jgi:hypothetical protein
VSIPKCHNYLSKMTILSADPLVPDGYWGACKLCWEETLSIEDETQMRDRIMECSTVIPMKMRNNVWEMFNE